MIPELKQLAYADSLDSLKLHVWTLEERRVRADLIEVYKIVHVLSAIPLSFFSNLRTVVVREVTP